MNMRFAVVIGPDRCWPLSRFLCCRPCGHRWHTMISPIIAIATGSPIFSTLSPISVSCSPVSWGFRCLSADAPASSSPANAGRYAIFFLGVLLTALGSGYYHLAPDNETLFWDRLPMTIAFMGLVSSQIVDRINVRSGLVLLLPMLLLGVASVVYWSGHRAHGRGECHPLRDSSGLFGIRPAAAGPVASVALYPRQRYLLGIWLVCAEQVAGDFRRPGAGITTCVSGHTLKHLAAAAAGFAFATC